MLQQGAQAEILFKKKKPTTDIYDIYGTYAFRVTFYGLQRIPPHPGRPM